MTEKGPDCYLPDFCHLPRIAAVCGVAQLVVILMFLAPLRDSLFSATTFLFASAFAQWLALTAALALCKSRRLVSSLRPALGYSVAAVLPATITALAAGLVFYLDHVLAAGYFQGVNAWRFVSGIVLIVGILCAVLLRYFYVREQWQSQVKANAKASLQALQARINPHFLFNSMNTIAALVRKDPKTAEIAIEDLSDLFRAALGDENMHSTLADELQITRQYLAIEQLRFGTRLRMQWQLADDLPMHCRMPRLLLQPLLENAIVHGIALLAEGGEIIFSARKDKDKLVLQVQNPIASGPSHHGFGHALDSVQRRIALYFGTGATLEKEISHGNYSCTICIPYE